MEKGNVGSRVRQGEELRRDVVSAAVETRAVGELWSVNGTIELLPF